MCVGFHIFFFCGEDIALVRCNERDLFPVGGCLTISGLRFRGDVY